VDAQTLGKLFELGPESYARLEDALQKMPIRQRDALIAYLKLATEDNH